jgi:hypothetical protein
VLARSRTSSDALSSSSTLVAPARGCGDGKRPQDLGAHELGDVGLAQGPGQAFAREPYLLCRVGDLLAFPGHHLVDRGDDFFETRLGETVGSTGCGLSSAAKAQGAGVMFSMVPPAATGVTFATHHRQILAIGPTVLNDPPFPGGVSWARKWWC